jgi:serine/threonine protein kinase
MNPAGRMATCPKCRAQYPADVELCPADGEGLLPDEAFSNADQDLASGEKVGEYVIDEKIGHGGFGAVFRATHPLIGKTVAIKVLFRQYSSNPQMVSRFIAEARAVNQIRHKNIIDIFAFGQLADGRHYYVMELVTGQPLDQVLEQHGRLGLTEAVPVLRQLARALDAAHAKGIAHRDLKPENIYLATDDEGGVFPKLLDFGIAKLLSDGPQMHKTRTGAPMGTPYYMSPEQCRGREIDHRTDIYSFGILCFETLTARVPFDGDDYMEILLKQINDPPPRPSSFVPELPPRGRRAGARDQAPRGGGDRRRRPDPHGAPGHRLLHPGRPPVDGADQQRADGAGLGWGPGATGEPGPVVHRRRVRVPREGRQA